MKRITVWLFAIALVLAPRFVFAADKGLHLGGLGKDAKKAQIETKKSTQEMEKDARKAKKKAEKEAKKKQKELEKKKKQAEKEAQKKKKDKAFLVGTTALPYLIFQIHIITSKGIVMKSALIIFLTGLAVFLGFSVYSLRKELLNTRQHTVFLEERNDSLQKELMRMNRVCSEKEQFMNEIEKNITELENKVSLETLERHIPKKTWSEIKPIIDRLKAFQEERESSKLPRKQEGNL